MRRALFTLFMLLLLTAIPAVFAQAGHGVDANWHAPVQVSHTPGTSSGVVGRNLAVDSKGVVHVVWSENTGSSFDIMYARSTDGGLTWSEARDILPDARLPVYGPNLVIGPNDTLHLAWNDRREGTARVFYSHSTDGGDSWSSLVNISLDNDRDAGGHHLSVDGYNRVHIAWHVGDPAEDTEPTVVYYARSVDGGLTFETPRRLNTGQAHAAFPRFSVEDTSGDILAIAWRDNRQSPDWGVYVAVSTDGGATFTERVGCDERQTREWDPEIVVDTGGVLHLSCMTLAKPGEGTIVYLQSHDLGQTWTAPVVLSEADSRFPFWATDQAHGILWLFWKDERDFLSDSCQPPSRCADLMGKYSSDGGMTWSEAEFLTDYGATEVKFPAYDIGPDGTVYALWSLVLPDTNNEEVFVTWRSPGS